MHDGSVIVMPTSASRSEFNPRWHALPQLPQTPKPNDDPVDVFWNGVLPSADFGSVSFSRPELDITLTMRICLVYQPRYFYVTFLAPVGCRPSDAALPSPFDTGRFNAVIQAYF